MGVTKRHISASISRHLGGNESTRGRVSQRNGLPCVETSVDGGLEMKKRVFVAHPQPFFCPFHIFFMENAIFYYIFLFFLLLRQLWKHRKCPQIRRVFVKNHDFSLKIHENLLCIGSTATRLYPARSTATQPWYLRPIVRALKPKRQPIKSREIPVCRIFPHRKCPQIRRVFVKNHEFSLKIHENMLCIGSTAGQTREKHRGNYKKLQQTYIKEENCTIIKRIQLI